MALTNALLKSMGIENDQRDQIMAAHQEVLESIKKERDELRDTAAKVPELESRIQELEANKPTEDWEAKYNDVSSQFEAYKAQVAAEKADAEKARLYRALLRESGIDEKRIDAIMKVTDLSGVSVQDGVLSEADALKENIAEEWKEFIPQIQEHGAQVATPPTSSQTTGGANPEVLKRLQERHERKYGVEPAQQQVQQQQKE